MNKITFNIITNLLKERERKFIKKLLENNKRNK